MAHEREQLSERNEQKNKQKITKLWGAVEKEMETKNKKIVELSMQNKLHEMYANSQPNQVQTQKTRYTIFFSLIFFM